MSLSEPEVGARDVLIAICAHERQLVRRAVDPYGNQRIGLEGTTTINPKDFGVSWNAALEAGGVLLSDEVVLKFESSAIKSASGA